MKFSEVCRIVQAVSDASMSPSRMSVIFGCDCGCGGDFYTEKRWDEEEEAAAKAIEEAKEFCAKFCIEYDDIE